MKTASFSFVLLASVSARAVIFSSDALITDFTNQESITNVTWSIATNGWSDGNTNIHSDFWIQSIPVAIGESWRPAGGATVMVAIDPAPDGLWTYYKTYARYSPDKKHWSSWQMLESVNSTNWNQPFHRAGELKLLAWNHPTNAYQICHGEIEVPRAEREKYDHLFSEYQTMDVPWTSDEEAAVKWILTKEPKFFENQLPFAGYVQYRVEGRIRSDQKIRRIEMTLDWAISGLSSIAKDPNYKAAPGPWRFEAP